MLDWLVEHPGVRAGLATLGERVVRREIGRLGFTERHRISHGRHVVCDLLARIAVELERLTAVHEHLAREIVDEAFPNKYHGINRVRVAIMKAALKALLSRALQTPAIVHLQELLTLVRAAAIACCPNPGKHPLVRRACVEPLAKQAAREEITCILRNVAAA